MEEKVYKVKLFFKDSVKPDGTTKKRVYAKLENGMLYQARLSNALKDKIKSLGFEDENLDVILNDKQCFVTTDHYIYKGAERSTDVIIITDFTNVRPMSHAVRKTLADLA